ncbi:MAG: hypothetical protein HY736_25875 [Verrucomicrobia bacterium]|nr:hypothetical protein [Verrucomicrobiota bacterium]
MKTNAVQGDFTPREALERMLSRTALTVKQDERTGALAIIPTPVSSPPAGNSSELAPPPHLQSIAKKKHRKYEI